MLAAVRAAAAFLVVWVGLFFFAPQACAQTLADLPTWARTPGPPIPRRALVVAVGAYDHAPQLTAPTYDGRDVYNFLFNNHFLMQPLIGPRASWSDIDAAIRTFRDAIKPGDIVVVFFSGHGLRRGDGNYFVPSDATAVGPTEEPASYISLHYVMRELAKNNPLSVVIVVDACRRDPFKPNAAITASAYEPEYSQTAAPTTPADGGLAEVASHDEVAIGYSAGVNALAFSYLGGEAHTQASFFTRTLIADLGRSPSFQHGFRLTSRDVSDRTHVLAPILLNPAAPDFLVVRSPNNLALQNLPWIQAVEGALAGNEADVLQTFVDLYPTSDFASVARDELRRLHATTDEAAPIAQAQSIENPGGLWAGTLRSPYVDAARVPDLAFTTRQVPLVLPRLGGLFFDNVIATLPEGQRVRIVGFEANQRLTRVQLPDGTIGYVSGVVASRAPITARADLVFDGGDFAAALQNPAALEALNASLQTPGAQARIFVGGASEAYTARSRQIAFSRALTLRHLLGEHGADITRIRIEIADPDTAADHARIEVSGP